MLHGQMLTLQMSPRQLTTHADGLTIQPSKFGRVLTSNSGDMASYLLLNYRDPKVVENGLFPWDFYFLHLSDFCVFVYAN